MKRRFRCIESSFFVIFLILEGESCFSARCTPMFLGLFWCAGVSLLRERRGGFAVAPSTPSRCTLPCFWGDEVESTRGHSLKVRSTQSRERVKGETPLRSPEAEPLVGLGAKLLSLPQYKRSRTSHPASRLGATYEFSIIIICTMRVSSRTNWSTVMLPSM